MFTYDISQIEDIARELTKSACQLFINKEGKKEVASPFGSAVLFSHNENSYLISCAHVLIDNEKNPPYFFKSKNEISTIGGHFVFTDSFRLINRTNDKFDIAIVKLNKKTIDDFTNNGYIFLKESSILTGYKPSDKDYALCIGYPATRTKVNSSNKTIEMYGLRYISKFVHYDLIKYGFNSQFHFVVKYSINQFITNNNKIKHRGPKPHGLSGGGVWAIFRNEKKEMSIKLVGIMTEYREEHSLIISTRIDLIMDSLRQKFDSTIINQGIKVDLI